MKRRTLLGVALAAVLVFSAAYGEGLDTDNVVVVLDASGSMSGLMPRTSVRKMDAAKSALLEVLKTIPKSTHIGILVFSGLNVPNEWIYPLGPRDDALLAQAIARPQPSGQTPLGAYIKKGADALLAAREKQFGYGTYRLLIVTDGEAQDRHLVDRYTPEVLSRGITMDVIGVNMASTHTLATKVNSYRAANDPESLRRAVADIFAEVSTGAQDTATGEDAFDTIRPLPVETAVAALAALRTTGNQPIGTRPAAGEPSPPTAPAPTPGQPVAPAPAASRGNAFRGVPCCCLVLIVAAVIIIGAARNASRKRGGT